jgi:putative nucleotidyltransferase with HDIG domain
MITSHPTWADWINSGEWAGSSDTAMPMLPALATDVMSLALDQDVSVVAIARVISKDQVLATRVLRLANSAYCAPMQEITTINDAIVRMGTAAVRSVVLAVCFASRMDGQDIYGSKGRVLVDHGIGTAYLARLVAERVYVDPDEAFVCGLLHDIGKMLLVKLERDFVRFGGRAPSVQEFERLVTTRHAEIGAQVLGQWRLPARLQESVLYHHSPEQCSSFPEEAAVAYMGNRLAHRYGFGCDADTETDLLEDPVFVKHKVTADWLADTDKRAPGLFQVAKQIVA